MAPDPGGLLTSREMEVAALAAAGLTNRMIGERLVISRRTVDRHIDHVFAKTGLRDRTRLAAWLETGAVPGPAGKDSRAAAWRRRAAERELAAATIALARAAAAVEAAAALLDAGDT